MTESEQFSVIAIPLSRPEIVDFLIPTVEVPRGAPLRVVDQRPSHDAKRAWIERLESLESPTLDDLLRIDDPHGHLRKTYTDRLVPVEFLNANHEFLTQKLGGWAPIYFGVVGLAPSPSDDPLLRHRETLEHYGDRIRTFGADPALVAARLDLEAGADVPTIASALVRLYKHRRGTTITGYIEEIFREILSGNRMATADEPPIPELLLHDELMRQLVRLERARRRAIADGREVEAETIRAWQSAREREGLRLILKGEYIMGRHRSSTIVIAEELGVVIKQPAPEPFHEIVLGARTYDGLPENWPVLTGTGALVTSRGRLRLVLEEGLIPRLDNLFGHEVHFSSLLGIIVEEYIDGETTQARVWRDPSQLTPQLYETYVFHQQVCEALGVENGDWHAANFIYRRGTDEIVHIDWGAARPLRDDEYTPEAIRGRIEQVVNLAYSFHDDELAERCRAIHRDLLADESRMERLRTRARELAARA